jgi:pyruvate, water dikinase
VVAEGLYPELTAALGNLGGIIAEEGSAAGHFATIARESSIPVVINVPDALEIFQRRPTGHHRWEPGNGL